MNGSKPESRATSTLEGTNVYTCSGFGGPVIKNGKAYLSDRDDKYGDLLIIASQAPEAGVVAYKKQTGDVVWKTPSLGKIGFVSPSIAKISGIDQVIMITASSGRGGFGDGTQDPFLESMAKAASAVAGKFGDEIMYINVMNNLSVDCVPLQMKPL